jgi:minor extracellular serine protease Vpr
MQIQGTATRSGPGNARRARSKAMVLLAVAALCAACSSIIKDVEPGTRYGTAAALAGEAFPDGADTALIATGRDFADALAAAPVSATRSGPILLTEPDAVPDDTMDALADLGVTDVVLLGGTAAISEDVEAQLTDASYEVVRKAGGDRFETAAELAQLAYPDGADTVLLATGAGFADALAAAPLAAKENAPILLASAEHLPAATGDALVQLGANQVIILGGAAAIGDDVERLLATAGYETGRLAGPDRTATAAILARAAHPAGATVALLTTGADFPDALAAAPLAAERGGPILLTGASTVPDATMATLAALGVEEVVLIGGTAVIGEAVEDALSDASYDVSRLPG